MSKYEGIRIPDEICIVEKHNHQGYIVYKDDKKMLANALSWAGDYYYTWDPDTRNSESHSYTPQVHTYKNGTFRLVIKDAAGSSWSQSGKLSFWNCTIKAEDGKEFLIGINSDALCSLIKNSNMKLGEVEQPVWLGKRKGNTVAYTELMEEFKQAKLDDSIRNTAQTVKYEKGQLVGTVTSKSLYCGVWYKYFDIIEPDWYHRDSQPTVLRLYTKPVPVHAFAHYYEDSDSYWLDWPDILLKKPKRITYEKFAPDVPAKTFAAYTTVKQPEKPVAEMAEYDRYSYTRQKVETELHALQYGLDDSKSINSADIVTLWQSLRKAAPSKITVELA